MQRLVHLDDGMRQHLVDRARDSCVVFTGAELPRGCSPDRGRIGIETDAAGEVSLLIDLHHHYGGSDPLIDDWITHGETRFGDAAQFWSWIDSTIQVTGTQPDIRYEAIDVGDRTAAVAPTRGDLLGSLKMEIFGQDRALDAIAAVTSRHLAQQAPTRPLSILALGPTGTGKSQTAASLARTVSNLTDGDYSTLHLDMIEYQEGHSVARFFGSPPGYIGYQDGRSLADLLSENPRSVIVFDEIEKAHPNVLAALLAIMETGRLSASNSGDREGIDARRSVFFFTSNLGAPEFLSAISDLDDAIEVDHLGRRHLRARNLRPEFVGRIHRIVGYQPLAGTARSDIMAKAVAGAGQAYGLRVRSITPEAMAELMGALNRADGSAGARSVAYIVDELVGDAFADAARSGAKGDIELAGAPLALRGLDTYCLAEGLTGMADVAVARDTPEGGDDDSDE